MGKDTFNGWLSPTGRLFEVYGFARHNEWAMDFLEKKWLKSGRLENAWELNEEIDKELDSWSGYAHQVLEQWGWVRVLDWGTEAGMQFLYDKKPNKRQLRVIFDLCIKYKVDPPDELFG